jgi:phosphoglycolate phosphatase-like HAD superfamily hydrolase
MNETLGSSIKDRSSIFQQYEKRMQESNLTVENYRLLTIKYSNLVDDLVTLAPQIKGAEKLLKTLKNNNKIIMISSATPKINLKNIIKNRNWSKYFDVLSGMPMTKMNFIKEIILKYNIKASEICVVGDGSDDRFSAEEYGCNFLPVGNLNKVKKNYKLDDIINLIEHK